MGAQGTNTHHRVSLQLESRPGRRRAHAHQLFVPAARSIRKEEIVEFLKTPGAHLKQPLLVSWDGLKTHRSRLVREYLDRVDGHIQIAFLPPYAPHMKPVGYPWAWLKRHARANYCPNDLGELHERPQQAQQRPKAPFDHCRLLDAGYAVVTP